MGVTNVRRTAYQKLASRLRQLIMGGELAPGAKLPTERQLCDKYDTSRITVRRSLQILEEEMLIERRQGDGTYVSRQPTRRIPVLDADFSGAILRHAPELSRETLTYTRTQMTEAMADHMPFIPDDEVMCATRVDLLAGERVATDLLVIPVVYATNLSGKLLSRVTFAEAWAKAEGLTFSHVKQTIEAVSPDTEIAGILNVPQETSLLRETAVYFQKDNVALGCFVTHYRSDVFRFTSTTVWQEAGRTL